MASVNFPCPEEDVHVMLLKHARASHRDKKQHARAVVVTKHIKTSLQSTNDNPWTCCDGVQIHVFSERPV